MDKSLYDLMQRTAKGDQNAFRLLARTLSPALFRAAYRLMGYNHAAAEDALQDALIKLWMNAPKWQPTGSVEGYAHRILHNCCMDALRKYKPESELGDYLPDQTPGAAQMLYEKEQQELLMNGINGLPERQKTALLMSYFGDESNKKIAESMSITEKAVESLLVRARAALARDLPGELKTQFGSRPEKGERR